jgi:hypothetical protein
MVRGDQPFTVVEEEDFQPMLEHFRCEFSIPSASTVKREIMKMHEEEIDHVRDRLQKAGSRISLALDCWTSLNTKAFLGITAHYIDDAWIPRSLVLDLAHLPGLHTGKDLCETLVAKCDQFGILDNILGITTDNAANIDKLLGCFEQACHDRCIPFDRKQQHVRCMAHVANLAVQTLLRGLGAEASDGDSSPNSDTTTQAGQLPCIAKLRRLVVNIRGSPQRREEFKGQCGECGTPRKEVILDTRTRWNSTYAMIERARELRAPLDHVAKTRRDLSELSDEDWELLEVVAQLLSIFDDATQELCATSYPTLNSAVPAYNYIFDKLEDFHSLCDDEADDEADSQDDEADSQDDEADSQDGSQDDEAGSQEYAAIINQCSPAMKRTLKNAIEATHRKMRDYYAKTWADMYAIALILDPRLKADYFEKKRWEPGHLAHAGSAIQRAVETYGDAMPPSNQRGTAGRRNPVKQHLHQVMKRRRVEKGSEMGKYLAEPTVDIEVNVLEWWKQNAAKYPCLARIARDYLAIPATSAPAERVFSGGADLITKKRGSLREDAIEACTCLKSWL